MRVAHIITRMIIGGAQENTLLNCLDLMQEFDDEVVLITGPALGPEGDLLKQGRAGELNCHYIDSLRRNIHPVRDASSYRALKKFLRTFKPDVVHTHSAKGGLLGRAAAWSLGVPAVLHSVHGAPFHPYQRASARRFFIGCEKWAAKRCHRMISVADAMTSLMVDAGVADREKFQTIYSGMDTEPFLNADRDRDVIRRELGYESQHVVIGKIARLFHLKGHEYLIEAAGEVARRFPNVRFLLVGDGILRSELEERISEMGLSSVFQFTGLVPPSRIPGLIGAMDGLVHTSLREGLARTLPQALLAGKPVISFDVDGAREVCITGETGVLVPARDIEGLKSAICQLADDPALRTSLGQEGRRRFADQFDHRAMTRRIRSLYEEVLESSR